MSPSAHISAPIRRRRLIKLVQSVRGHMYTVEIQLALSLSRFSIYGNRIFVIWIILLLS